MTTTFPLSGRGGFLSSAVVEEVVGGAVLVTLPTATVVPPPESAAPPTPSYSSHPSRAPGTSTARARVRGRRRGRRGCGDSNSGPAYDTSATLTRRSDPCPRPPQHP